MKEDFVLVYFILTAECFFGWLNEKVYLFKVFFSFFYDLE